ncbi:hypothetical protein K7432_009317 [Basidiobolus ranarum]
MLRRSSNISSFVNAHVFPGGNVDATEKLAEWLEPTKSPLYQQTALDYNPAQDELLKFKLCAIRETFEECGLLLTKAQNDQHKAFGAEELQSWRNLIYRDADKFIEICREHQMYPTVEQLTHFSNWITPINYPKRYDTHFFLTFLNVDLNELESTIIADGQESVHTVWYTPSQALRAFEKGEITLFPPQWYTLNELSQSKTISELRGYLSKCDKIVPFVPQFQKANSEEIHNFPTIENTDTVKLFSMLPGDESYSLPSVAVSKPGNRHRLWICKDKNTQRMFSIQLEKSEAKTSNETKVFSKM